LNSPEFEGGNPDVKKVKPSLGRIVLSGGFLFKKKEKMRKILETFIGES